MNKSKPNTDKLTDVQELVRDYLQSEQTHVTSSYWSFVKQMLTMRPLRLTPKAIREQFIQAYQQFANENTAKFNLTSFRRRVNMALRISLLDKEHLDKLIAENTGFYKAYRICLDLDETKSWAEQCLRIIQNQPAIFVDMIEQLVAKGQLPDNITTLIKQFHEL